MKKEGACEKGDHFSSCFEELWKVRQVHDTSRH